MMLCPSCEDETKITYTQTGSSTHSLPGELRGLNIVRRQRECVKGHKFFTIELPESDFDNLKRPTKLAGVRRLRA